MTDCQIFFVNWGKKVERKDYGRVSVWVGETFRPILSRVRIISSRQETLMVDDQDARICSITDVYSKLIFSK